MSVSDKLARRAQDEIFYQKEFPKEHVEWLVIRLTRLAEFETLWHWPDHKDRALKRMQLHFISEFGKRYTLTEMLNVIGRLHERHEVFHKLMKEPGVQWNSNTNKFTADSDLWEKLVEEDSRYSWYLMLGDPLWYDIGVLFEGDVFKYSSESMKDNHAPTAAVDAGEGSSKPATNCYELDKYAKPSYWNLRSPCRPPAWITLPDTPDSGKSPNVSPLVQQMNRFDSPLNNSPGIALSTEEAWMAGKQASLEKKACAAKKRIIWDWTKNPDSDTDDEDCREVMNESPSSGNSLSD